MSRSFGPPSPIRSPNYAMLIRGKRLTDRKIDEYILKGFYGEKARQALLAQKTKPKKRRSSWSRVKKLLDL